MLNLDNDCTTRDNYNKIQLSIYTMQKGKYLLSWYVCKTVKVNMMSYRTEKGIPDQVKTQ